MSDILAGWNIVVGCFTIIAILILVGAFALGAWLL